ncbi:MAG TPA: aspartate/glutamate racemase family protein [Phototrophicaceae bacterium]|nr:aspartate/glutamate racemase family protein [Phototrophicaceae bacterium]
MNRSPSAIPIRSNHERQTMHQKIGIIGGLSPESTVSYYLHITRAYTERFGDYGYPEILIYSVNLEQYHQWRSAGRWDCVAAGLIAAAHSLQAAGADFGLIATNTMHKVFDDVQCAVDLPLLHIIDVTIASIQQQGLKTVGLLGTLSTMSDTFYTDRLTANGLTPLVPTAEEQAVIHQVIVDELVRGCLREASKQRYLAIIQRLKAQGAEGIILGCTEIPLLIQPDDCDLPLFDTAILHAEAALARAMTLANGR